MEIKLLSRIITPDGTELTSAHRHDYNTHKDKNGEEYMIDGGLDYIRTSVNKEPAVLSPVIAEINGYEAAREKHVRFTAEGKVIPVSQMTDEHLKNCIIYNAERGMANTTSTLMYVLELIYRTYDTERRENPRSSAVGVD